MKRKSLKLLLTLSVFSSAIFITTLSASCEKDKYKKIEIKKPEIDKEINKVEIELKTNINKNSIKFEDVNTSMFEVNGFDNNFFEYQITLERKVEDLKIIAKVFLVDKETKQKSKTFATRQFIWPSNSGDPKNPEDPQKPSDPKDPEEPQNPTDPIQQEIAEMDKSIDQITVSLKANLVASQIDFEQVSPNEFEVKNYDNSKYEVQMEFFKENSTKTVTIKVWLYKPNTTIKSKKFKEFSFNNFLIDKTMEEEINTLQISSTIEPSNIFLKDFNEQNIQVNNYTKEKYNTKIELEKNEIFNDLEVKVYLVNKNTSAVSQNYKYFKLNGFKTKEENNISFNGEKFYKPEENSNLFKDKHIFSKESLTSQSPKQIWYQTPLYKASLNNFLWTLKNYNNGQGIDFNNFVSVEESKKMSDEFFKNLTNVGIYGDYGSSDAEKIKYFNQNFSSEFMMKQKYLDKFEESEATNAQEKTISLEEIVKKNPFGFLPSNLSQFLYFLKLKDIENVFSISNLKEVKANFDDGQGTIEILLTTTNGQKYIIKLKSNTSDYLKSDNDFHQYIYERSFSLNTRSWQYQRHPYISSEFSLRFSDTGGTAWLIDRIPNEELQKQGKYEFLVATNIHVATTNEIFDKSLTFIDPYVESVASKNWYGGFWHSTDKKETVYAENNIKYEIINNLKPLNERQGRFIFGKPESPFALSAAGTEVKYQWGTNAWEQYLDMNWYTPRFISSGVKRQKADAETYLYDIDSQTRIGKTKNAGADFVVLKLQMTESNVQSLFPNLYSILNKPEEANWYVGVGKDEEFLPMQTQYIGGFPQDIVSYKIKYKNLKSTGGYVVTKNRIIPDSAINSIWTRYNEAENKDWNSTFDKWKRYIKPYRNDIPHGMAKQTIMQLSMLQNLTDQEGHLTGGSSGSMCIDSKFNLVGINYLETSSNDNKYYGNTIALFNSQTPFENFEGSIRKEILNKLKKENLKTVKLNNN